VELEFHTLARNLPVDEGAPAEEELFAAAPAPPTTYVTIDTVAELGGVLERARAAPFISIDVEGVVDPRALQANDPLRTTLAGLSIAVGAGEAFYFSLAHRARQVGGQVGLGFDELLADTPDRVDDSGGKRTRGRKTAEPTTIA